MNIFNKMLGIVIVSVSFFYAQAAFADVAVLGAPGDPAWSLDVRDKIAAVSAGSLGVVDVFDVSTATPTLPQLLAYTAVLVFSDTGFFDAVALGDVLADYVDGGGVVVIATFAYNINPIGGRIVTGNYMPLSLGDQSGGLLTLVPVDPSHPLLVGVTSFDGGTSSYHNDVTTTVGATLVANWSNGLPLIAVKGSVVGLNFYPPSSDARADFWDAGTDGARIMANALGHTGVAVAPPVPVPTLSEWGMIVLSSLLAVGTILTLRRQRL
jgi:hypothetical protein